jgi:membrane protease subunit HflC
VKKIITFAIVLLLGCAALIIAGGYGWGPVVVTQEGSQKIILFMGKDRAVTQPGWALRFPLLDSIQEYDSRLLYLNTAPDVIQTKDQERIVVDNYAMWRIEDATHFLESFPTGRKQAEKQIDRVVRAGVREVVARHTLTEVLTDKRTAIMEEIRKEAAKTFAGTGVAITDVRINRTELPDGVEKNVYARMKTDRERLARKYRAEGGEQARRIRAEADREAQVIVATARGAAEVVRGEGDATAARIYAEAYGHDPDFFAFVRSLEAYRKTIGKGTTLVLSPDSEFFQFFGSSSPRLKDGTPASKP